MDNRPDVFVVGAPKCGTTSLYEYLGQHGDVFVAAKKELHYYSAPLLREHAAGPGDQMTLANIVDNEPDYLAHFARAQQRRLVDVSPSYLFNHEVCSRIKADSPQAYILAILRDPAERAYSQWLHQRRFLHEHLPFMQALDAEASRATANWSDAWRYVGVSRYAPGIRAYQEAFGPDRVCVVTAEDLLAHPQRTMDQIFAFLELDTTVAIREAHRNQGGDARYQFLARQLAGPSRPRRVGRRMLTQSARTRVALRLAEFNTVPAAEMPPAARERLVDTFAKDIPELEAMLNRFLPWQR